MRWRVCCMNACGGHGMRGEALGQTTDRVRMIFGRTLGISRSFASWESLGVTPPAQARIQSSHRLAALLLQHGVAPI